MVVFDMATGTTFEPIDFKRDVFLGCQPDDLVAKVEADLEKLRDQRLNFYKTRLKDSWANSIRNLLVFLASIASLLTAVAAVIRITEVKPIAGVETDIVLFAVAFLFYAAMGALLIAEKSGDISSRYFRALGTILAIRDLSTKLQFSLLDQALKAEQLPKNDAAAELAFRQELFDIAEAFCVDLGKLTQEELTTFQNEYTASISELDTIAQQGKAGARQGLEEAVTALREARAEARQEAATEEAARKPALVSVTVKTAFDGDLRILVANVEKAKSGSASFALDALPTGPTKVEAIAEKDGQQISYSGWVDLTPGIQSLEIELT